MSNNKNAKVVKEENTTAEQKVSKVKNFLSQNKKILIAFAAGAAATVGLQRLLNRENDYLDDFDESNSEES